MDLEATKLLMGCLLHVDVSVCGSIKHQATELAKPPGGIKSLLESSGGDEIELLACVRPLGSKESTKMRRTKGGQNSAACVRWFDVEMVRGSMKPRLLRRRPKG